MGMEYCS